ncbi:MAG: hypothetical protein P4L87_00980, partial [Formivibrio sp.]|nr:hypothetical protein [Formivibrio sp.]
DFITDAITARIGKKDMPIPSSFGFVTAKMTREEIDLIAANINKHVSCGQCPMARPKHTGIAVTKDAAFCASLGKIYWAGIKGGIGCND